MASKQAGGATRSFSQKWLLPANSAPRSSWSKNRRDLCPGSFESTNCPLSNPYIHFDIGRFFGAKMARIQKMPIFHFLLSAFPFRNAGGYRSRNTSIQRAFLLQRREKKLHQFSCFRSRVIKQKALETLVPKSGFMDYMPYNFRSTNPIPTINTRLERAAKKLFSIYNGQLRIRTFTRTKSWKTSKILKLSFQPVDINAWLEIWRRLKSKKSRFAIV